MHREGHEHDQARQSGALAATFDGSTAPEVESLTGKVSGAWVFNWARVGKRAEENPDLTCRLIKDILIGIEELEQGQSSEYQ
ncbi:MAG: hypothetical protein O2923_13715 [Verrucomicrobia bacterium]|nr:hypothetical protein [Verrucomicrobiota bacterium]MDA1086438.1 hypothetical protein [Verrucomicrobiota bacterium]